MSYLLDTNVCIALINGTSTKVRARFAEATRQKAGLATSTIVIHQLWHRAAKDERATRYAHALAAFLSRMPTPPEKFVRSLNGRAGGLANTIR